MPKYPFLTTEQRLPTISIQGRLFYPRCTDGLAHVRDLRKFVIHYGALKKGLTPPPVVVTPSGPSGLATLLSGGYVVCAKEALGATSVQGVVLPDPSTIYEIQGTGVSAQEKAIRSVLPGRTVILDDGQGRHDMFTIVDSYIEHEVAYTKKGSGPALIEYILPNEDSIQRYLSICHARSQIS